MGWLALSGVPPVLDKSSAKISERLLELSDLSRQPLLFTPDPSVSEEVQRFVSDLEILLGLEIQIVNPADLGDEALRDLWLNAGIMILTGGSPAYWEELVGDRLFRMRPQEILAEGAVLFAVGVPASVMGAWRLDSAQMGVEKGLGWVIGGVTITTNSDPAEIAVVRNHLEEREGVYALGLPDGALLALGPHSEIEVWTEKAPVLLLGKGWQK